MITKTKNNELSYRLEDSAEGKKIPEQATSVKGSDFNCVVQGLLRRADSEKKAHVELPSPE